MKVLHCLSKKILVNLILAFQKEQIVDSEGRVFPFPFSLFVLRLLTGN